MTPPALSALILSLALLPGAAAADGAVLFADNCSGCHGEAGEGNADLRAPALAALDAAYLDRQVAHFRSGLRRAEEDNDAAQGMIAILPDLTGDETAAISAYLAALPLPVLDDETDPPGFRGRGLYSGCSSCHGVRAQGTAALNAPRLTGQFGWYLADQLRAFRAGRRGFHADDEPGRQMKAMADQIGSEADIDQIVAYIASLDR